MDLSTTYLGFKLPHPFIAGASPLSEEVDGCRQLEDAGSAAIILPSLFEERIRMEQQQTVLAMETHADAFAEALSYFPEPSDLDFGAEHYLDQIRKVKAAVGVPVIASLNGATDSGWLDYARLMQDAGASALELNIYFVATDLERGAADIENEVVAITRHVKGAITIPVSVKLSAAFTSFANIAHRLDGVGADGLVIFNRFFQPDIDVENVSIRPVLQLSDPNELPLRLAWLGILYGKVKASLGVTGGIHRPIDAIKAIMSGADALQIVSALLKNGPQHLKAMKEGVARWLEEHEYESLGQMKGSMSLTRAPDPAAYQRANYMKLLHSWRQ